ncbi:uncharacterized protein LOC128670247 isoform X2 [Plodia interpunctella]|nr:uncharacterized protein LOC128670247 isoform X2 [Plodia interpunctella]
MRASKSWIKRYGDVVSNPSKECDQKSEKAAYNSTLEKVDEISPSLTKTDIGGASEGKKTIEPPNKSTAPNTNPTSPKQADKKKPVQRSSILRKNSLNPNDKKASSILPSKKNSTPPKRISINKSPSRTTPNSQSKEKDLKTILSPGKARISSQFAFDAILSTTTNTTPAFIVPAKLSKKEITNGNDLSENTNQDVSLVKPANSSHNNVKQEMSRPEYDSGQKVFETLETAIKNVNSNNNEGPTKNHTDPKYIDPFSTSMNVGDVINLRLSIELKNDMTDTYITKKANLTIPVSNNNDDYWNDPAEKSSQANIDEVGPRNETMKNVLNDLNKNVNPQQYVIFYCDCCHGNVNIHETAKRPSEILNDQVRNINKKDYIILLPSTKHDVELMGCKCDDIPKLDKNVQTSIDIGNVECINVVPTTANIDQSRQTNSIPIGVRNVLQHPSVASENETLRGKSAILDDIAVTPPNESRTLCTTNQACSNLINKNDFGKNKLTKKKINSQCAGADYDGNGMCSKDNDYMMNTEIYDGANMFSQANTLDKSTQTDNHSLLLEARRQSDGHFSFHLPPLHLVKLYQKNY